MSFRSFITDIDDIFTTATEYSHALTRVVGFLFVGMLLFFSDTSGYLIAVLYGMATIPWIMWIKKRPTVKHRILYGMILDQTIISIILWVNGPTFSVITLLYFWIIISNGFRFQSINALYACVLSFIGYGLVAIAEMFTPEMGPAKNHNMLLLSFIAHTSLSFFVFKMTQRLEWSIRDKLILLHKELESVEKRAKTDGLTGLKNRDVVNDIIYKAIQNNTPTGILFMDLDNFKQINDRHGHDIGDEVLINTGKRLLSCVRGNDVVCRYAGDEFIIIINDASDEVINEIAYRISGTLSRPLRLRTGSTIDISATGSIGISVVGVHGHSPQEVIRKADAAMYMAKRAGRNQVAWYKEELENKHEIK